MKTVISPAKADPAGAKENSNAEMRKRLALILMESSVTSVTLIKPMLYVKFSDGGADRDREPSTSLQSSFAGEDDARFLLEVK